MQRIIPTHTLGPYMVGDDYYDIRRDVPVDVPDDALDDLVPRFARLTEESDAAADDDNDENPTDPDGDKTGTDGDHAPTVTAEDLDKHTRAELIALARTRGIDVKDNDSKAVLVAAIVNAPAEHADKTENSGSNAASE